MTKAVQETAVGEGLALGCLALGITAVTSEKTAIELSFRHAWRTWDRARYFPAVHASSQRDDILRILRASPDRRTGSLAAWNCGRTYAPYLPHGWSVQDAAEVLHESSGVTLKIINCGC